MSHSHEHPTAGAGTSRRLTIALLLAASYLGAEVVGGLWTGSLALLADAGHMLSDVASLALALFAAWLARKPPTVERTFGYHRAEVLAALANALALVAIGVFVIVEAVERFQQPPEVLAAPMLAIATGGLGVNIVALLILRSGQRDSMNVRGAFLHVMADALGSVGAMTSGVLIWALGWRWADPAASFFIALLVLVSAFALLRQTVRVLMQVAPSRLRMDELRARMAEADGVCSVHDVHAWTLAGGRELLSAHVVIDEHAGWPAVLGDLNDLLRDELRIAHVTLQPEHPSAKPCVCAFASLDTEGTKGQSHEPPARCRRPFMRMQT